MQKTIGFVALTSVVLLLAGCGKPQVITNEEMNVAFEIPGGWKTMYEAPGQYNSEQVLVMADGSTTLAIQDVTNAKYDVAPDSLEMLVEAMTAKGFTSVNASTTAAGAFGGLFTKEGEESLIYYVLKKDGKTIKCANGAYYKEANAEAADKVCASIK